MINKYKKKDVAKEEVVNQIVIPKKDLPRIIFLIGVCRVGSTALLKMFAASGYSSHRQPIKSIMRGLALEKKKSDYKWVVPKKNDVKEGTIIVKETIGPYTKEESKINPLELFIRATKRQGYSDKELSEKISLVILTRKQLAVWSSWIRNWGQDIPFKRLVDNYTLANKTVFSMINYAYSFKIYTLYYDYSKNQDVEDSTKELYDKLNLVSRPVVQGWRKKTYQDKIKNNLKIPNEPKLFVPAKVHTKVSSSAGLNYTESNPKINLFGKIKS